MPGLASEGPQKIVTDCWSRIRLSIEEGVLSGRADHWTRAGNLRRSRT